MNKYPECQSCVNFDTDHDVCDACEDADLFEPASDDQEIEWMSIDDFKQMFRRRTA